jgi:3-deoxy-7-phosphoheptulonate synthase
LIEDKKAANVAIIMLTSFPTSDLCSQQFSLIAGPCSIESYEIFRQVALEVKRNGGTALRGGIFKMRMRSETFQGLGAEAIEIVRKVKEEVALPFISEITDPRQIELLSEVVDVFQVGARNMHNYELLKELGKQRKPILLKRGLAAYLDEFLAATEYISNSGNSQIILCERGIRTFERSTRNTLDLSAVPYLKKRSGLPVIVDPSHGTGLRELVSPMCLAAAAAGADGVMVEVHPNPAQALSDGPQALTFEDFRSMVPKLVRVIKALENPMDEDLSFQSSSLKTRSLHG